LAHRPASEWFAPVIRCGATEKGKIESAGDYARSGAIMSNDRVFNVILDKPVWRLMELDYYGTQRQVLVGRCVSRYAGIQCRTATNIFFAYICIPSTNEGAI
jgi:hypothetical protein|tara:strand:+ start:396 stop:701 length:306 start_codon:yes stop_codon:yes gene_type:complete